MNKKSVLLGLIIAASMPFSVVASELDNEGKIANSSKRPAGLPAVVIVRENKATGTHEVAIDKSGACAKEGCDVAKLDQLKFSTIEAGQKYVLKGQKMTSANELDLDSGAGRESWYWGFGWGYGYSYGYAYNWYYPSYYYYYTPYWGNYYGSYYYNAYCWSYCW